nr:uncharacterized protein LOC109148798 [Ipomoea batatas]GMD63805.1 uncharacterized protein LOC109148798 [Ipomoea batatas]GMD66550.1 uncharacterized protein LOC109148798 [Ipomoea batatas]
MEVVVVILVLQLVFVDQGVHGRGFSSKDSYVSAIGDPGMKNPNSRFGLEAWNFCNEVGEEAPNMGSPRLADCADLYCPAHHMHLGSIHSYPLVLWPSVF